MNNHLWARLVLIALAFILTSCQGEMSALDPRGEGATHIANLWVVMLVIGALVYVQVIALCFVALFRRRTFNSGDTDPPDVSPPSPTTRTFIVANGIAIPIVVLT